MVAKTPRKPSPILPQGFALPIKPNGLAGKPPGKVSTACISLRMTPKDKRNLTKYVKSLRKGVSVWLREAIAEKLARELEEQKAVLGDAQAQSRQEDLDLEG